MILQLINNGKLITDEESLTNLFKDNYINITEKPCGFKPEDLTTNLNDISFRINLSLSTYKDHLSVKEMIKQK